MRFVLLILLLFGQVALLLAAEPVFYSLSFADRTLEIVVEIAATSSERSNGLMHRENLAPNHGMLFIFPGYARRQVWMKNTLISLDVLFLDKDGRISSVLPALPPCHQQPCPIYTSSYHAKFMLEVNSGYLQQHQLGVGDSMLLPELQ